VFADEEVVASAGALMMSEPVAAMMVLHDGGCRGRQAVVMNLSSRVEHFPKTLFALS